MDAHLSFLSRVSAANDKKILLIVVDGLGGLAHPDYGHKSELQYARLPNLDRFVQNRQTATGLIYPVRRGMVPGSGAGHLGLFGYDPFYYHVGRGALEAAGLDTDEIGPGDVMGRMNFCTLDAAGKISDRRAGRIASAARQVEALNAKMKTDGVLGASVKIVPGKEHRAVWVIKTQKGEEWSAKITDTDPQKVGAAPLQSQAVTPGDAAAARTADVVNAFTVQATEILRDFSPANGVVLRSFSTQPDLPNFNQVYSVKAAAISAYPLYRGIAQTVGMTVLKGADDFKQEVALLKENFSRYDFFFLHYKDTDSRGEDGDFLGKVAALERFDLLFADLMGMSFDVLSITGDHATPSVMSGHSHHPVPVAISAALVEGGGTSAHFDESTCQTGSLGQMVGADLMPLLLSYSGKMGKFEGFA